MKSKKWLKQKQRVLDLKRKGHGRYLKAKEPKENR